MGYHESLFKLDRVEFNYQHVWNTLSGYEIPQENHNPFSYECMSTARRAAIFASLFRNFTDFDKIEEATSDSKNEEAQTLEEIKDKIEVSFFPNLFSFHIKAYLHHMNRMMEWALSSPLLWPLPGQKQPTKDRPICVVQHQSFYRFFPIHNDRPCIAMDENIANFILYNCYKKREYIYDFSYDGPEPFVLRSLLNPPPQREFCAVSSQYESDLRELTAGLATRLRLLESQFGYSRE